MESGDNESISSDGIAPRKSVKRAWKRLEVRSRSTCQTSQYVPCMQNERKWLATQLKFEFTEEERRSLFEQWNVATDAKERKIRLIRKLWSAETVRRAMTSLREVLLIMEWHCRAPQGMEKSAHLVLKLLGSEDVEGGALDLIFRPPSRGAS